MEESTFSRTELLLGEENMKKLARAHVAVFGLGGVGGAAVESIARCGVGELTIVDMDRVSQSNINRQIIALNSTVGKLKCETAAERLHDINPALVIHERPEFYGVDNADSFDFAAFDYIVDAVDNVTAKLLLAERAQRFGVLEIACMGTGNKLDPTRLRVSDIYETSVCPLARVMRSELRKRGVGSLRVVWSDETPRKCGAEHPASVSFVPPVAGYLMAREVVLGITGVQ